MPATSGALVVLTTDSILDVGPLRSVRRPRGRVRVLPLTAEIAACADELQMHADPDGRCIVATALQHATVLITKDDRIRRLRFVKTTW